MSPAHEHRARSASHAPGRRCRPATSPLSDQRLDTPAVLVDLDVVEANIAHMAGFARRNGMALRPHIRHIKASPMARRQIEAGASGICCATATEAETMIAGGIRDVLLAYPLVGSPQARGV